MGAPRFPRGFLIFEATGRVLPVTADALPSGAEPSSTFP